MHLGIGSWRLGVGLFFGTLLESPDVEPDGEAAPPRGRELKLLAVVIVGQVLDGKREAYAIPPSCQVHAPTDAVHGNAVERQQVLRDEKRGIEQRPGHAR